MAELIEILGLSIPGVEPTTGDRGIFGGGVGIDTIDYITISITGNATDFGDLTSNSRLLGAASNGFTGRGVFGGGYDAGNLNIISYVTILSIGNATDFGDLTLARQGVAGVDNSENGRALFAGGAYQTIIDYITIATTGNATDFGDLTLARYELGGCSNGTSERGVFGGGTSSGPTYNNNVIDYVTINSTGNATDFGDLTVGRTGVCACSNRDNERGVFAGGWISGTTYLNTIDYVTINSTGNATDFGDLVFSKTEMAAASNGVNERGTFSNANWAGATSDSIDYITINSTGNAADFGNSTVVNRQRAGTSNA